MRRNDKIAFDLILPYDITGRGLEDCRITGTLYPGRPTKGPTPSRPAQPPEPAEIDDFSIFRDSREGESHEPVWSEITGEAADDVLDYLFDDILVIMSEGEDEDED